MKKQMSAVLSATVVVMALAAPASAALYSATGEVMKLRSHNVNANSLDWIAISGVTSLGSCGTFAGLVLFRLSDDERGKRQFAMATAARVAGLTVAAEVDDNLKDQWGYCYLRSLDI